MNAGTPNVSDQRPGAHGSSLQRLVGRHCRATLYKGDCLEVMREIETADAILTDPPYGTTACAWDAVIPFAPMWVNLNRICAGAIVLFSSQPFTTMLVQSNLEMFRYCLVWAKDRPSDYGNANQKPMRYHEDLCVFYATPPTFNKTFEERTGSGAERMNYVVKNGVRPDKQNSHGYGTKPQEKFYGDKKLVGTVISIPIERRVTGQHPTVKPVALMAHLVETYTNPGDTVLDFTMGSGTTGVACARLKRNFIGIERDAAHYKTACDRIAHELDGALL